MKYSFRMACPLLLAFAGILFTGCGPQDKKETARNSVGQPKPEQQVQRDTMYVVTDTSITFKVDDVANAKQGYNMFPLGKVVQKEFDKPIFIFPESKKAKVVPADGNGFLYTVHYAYASHHPLVLSPDEVWMQIALGVSLHINENYEKLQPKVMRFKDKQKIRVRMDELTELKPESWKRLVDTFALLTEAKVQPAFYKTMLPKFSTSTPLTQTAFRAAMMSSVKKGISYMGESGCGIPEVTLRGKKSDWEDIYRRLDELKQYDLAFWTNELKPVIKEFINVYDGKLDRQFWQRMYKYREGYMMQDVNGWIIKFFPYLTRYDGTGKSAMTGEGYEMPVTQQVYYKNPYIRGNEYISAVLNMEVFPQSYCTVPIIWDNLFEEKEEDQQRELKLVAGFFGFDQRGSSHALTPHVSWVILDETAENIVTETNRMWATEKRLDFDKYAWSDRILKGKQVNARYNPAKNKSFNAGMADFKKELTEHLKAIYPKESIAGTELKFTLTWIGHIVDASVKSPGLSPEAVVALKAKLIKMDFPFRPSQVKDNPGVDASGETFPASSQIAVSF